MIILKETIASFIGTLGFGILFNIKGKNLFFAAIGGGLSWFVYKVALLNFALSNTLSLFISSIIFSIYSEIGARKLKTPVTTLVICALIPLVPGGGMYYTMYDAVQADALKTWNTAISTLSAAGVLALGVIFVSTLTKLFTSVKYKYAVSKDIPKEEIEIIEQLEDLENFYSSELQEEFDKEEEIDNEEDPDTNKELENLKNFITTEKSDHKDSIDIEDLYLDYEKTLIYENTDFNHPELNSANNKDSNDGIEIKESSNINKKYIDKEKKQL